MLDVPWSNTDLKWEFSTFRIILSYVASWIVPCISVYYSLRARFLMKVMKSSYVKLAFGDTK